MYYLWSSTSNYSTSYNKGHGFSVRCVKGEILNIPTVTTTSISSITSTSSMGGGNVTSNGGATVTARGVCWSTNHNPTISNSKTTDGTGNGSFTSSISGLVENTTYFVRAYATNSQGTAYGNEISFTTTSSSSNTVADIDGNVYNTVIIGSLIWMKENLKTTRYRNGDLIGTTSPATLDISSQSNPKYQWAYSGNESNVSTYGRLYTWYAATDSRNICPTGWHVPTDEEWTTLTTFIGGENVAGGKLKESGTKHWQSPNTGATNSSGFSALPGGYRYFGGEFASFGGFGYWWSSSGGSTSDAWGRSMNNGDSNVYRGFFNPPQGFSVRCLRDN